VTPSQLYLPLALVPQLDPYSAALEIDFVLGPIKVEGSQHLIVSSYFALTLGAIAQEGIRSTCLHTRGPRTPRASP
jgi:hypothetical protein